MKLSDIVERKLGRRLDPSVRGSIVHLNHVPPAIVEEARSLGSALLAHEFLGWMTGAKCQSHLALFIQDVVVGGIDPRSWLRGRVLVPSVSLKEQLLIGRADLLAAIGGDGLVRVVPRIESWRAGSEWVGAPARVDASSDYLTPQVAKTTELAPSTPTEAVEDPRVATRRWIAARVAGVCAARGQLRSGLDLAAVVLPGIAQAQWSADARIALRGLTRELRELGRSDGDVPGFRGPDAWYRP